MFLFSRIVLLRSCWGVPCAALAVAIATLLAGPLTLAGDPESQTHWSFRPVKRAAVPSVRHVDLVESPVDAFILEKLESLDLEPSVLADKRTLIRRATYDLTGLPPTPAEVAEFLADDSPQAFATVVERLLASPHYGERWGRHWLDVARYANTRGDTGTDDNTSPFAFTYRDYVVRALNDDLPYDQFLIEQIAADQLGLGENSPALAALGFITVGRHFRGNVHDTIDDRIDVVTRGTMGLSVSCARCHDHKYDPIPTNDYYSLYGVLASSNEPDPLPIIGQHDAEAFADYQARRGKIEADRNELVSRQEAETVERYRKMTAGFLLASAQPEEKRERPADGEGESRALRRFGRRRWKDALEKINRDTDPVFGPWFAFAAIPEAEFSERAAELAGQVVAGKLPYRVNSLVAGAIRSDPPTSLKAVAEIYSKLLTDLSSPPEPAANDADRDALTKALLADDAPGNIPKDAFRKLLPPGVQMQVQQFSAELVRLDSDHRGAPLRAMALVDNPQPQTPRVFLRGNPNNPGPEVPRQFLEVIANQNRQPFSQGSGRLELARAIASPDNPLTARVIVNRVWMHHFGDGLVTTPDDFGVRSDEPSHPELLDYLASRFVNEGWSLKRLHRLLMLSRTYRQASDDSLRYEAIDPENRLLSKMNRRRLDFESLRDTLLAVAGDLDQAMGGRAVELTPQPKVSAGGAFVGPAKEQPPSLRRVIYAFIDRQNLPGLLRVFDFADPDTITGRRYVTTVPQQALFFFNNPLVMQEARSLVSSAEFRECESVSDRVRYLYQRVYQRDPQTAEIDLANRFIADSAPSADPARAGSASDPWQLLAHVLLMSDELMFVD